MTRKEFIMRSLVAGAGIPFVSTLLSSCGEDISVNGKFQVNFEGKVLVIGAGSAGMIAGHLLQQHDIDFEILEASSAFGGRVKKTARLADFPIDLGAEWIHTDPSILSELLNDENVDAQIDIINYSPETLYLWKNGELKKRNFFTNFYGEYKFKNTTWYDFFEQYIIPGIEGKISYNTPITHIDYSGDKVYVTDQSGAQHEADRLILTVPLTILKQEMITFNPPLPDEKTAALDGVDMPDGIKVFMRFSERFYPDLTMEGGLLENVMGLDSGEKIYYDAAFRKETDFNILGLFSVGDVAATYANQPSEEALIQFILEELDEMFDGKASENYEAHIIQNWSHEEFIRGSYSHYEDYDSRAILAAPVENKLYFAGEAYAPEDDLATVHGAGLSAFEAVKNVLKDE